MNRIEEFIDGQLIDVQKNWQDLKLILKFGEGDEELSSQTIEFAGDAAVYLRERIDGTNGGLGPFEGVPMEIRISKGNDVLSYPGYLDLADENTFVGGTEFVTKFKKEKGNDWLNDVADGFSYQHLFNIGKLTDFEDINYVVNRRIEGVELASLSLSIYILSKELIDIVKEITVTSNDVIEATTPNVGVGVNMDTGSIITGVIRLVTRIVIALLIAFALIKLIESVLDGLLPKKGIHKVVKVIDLFKSACDHLNMGFQSQLLESNKDLVIMPSRREEGTDTSLAIPTNYDNLGTFGDVIRTFSDVFLAEHRIIDNVLIFETESFFEQSGTYILPDVFTDQNKLQDNFRLNTNEFSANFEISFQIDTVDENTLDDLDRISFQVTHEPIQVGNPNLKLMKGLREVQIPLSLGKRKESFTVVENLALIFARSGDAVLKLLNKDSNFAASIEEKLNSLLLTSEFTSRPKLLYVSDGQITRDISAADLWEFHKSRSFVGDDPNQWLIFDSIRIPLSLEQFKVLISNEFGISAETGERVRMESVEWLPAIDMADVDFRVKRKYTNNIKQLL